MDFKGLARKLSGLLPESGPIVTQQQGHYGHPHAYGYPSAYGGGPAVINTKYGNNRHFQKNANFIHMKYMQG